MREAAKGNELAKIAVEGIDMTQSLNRLPVCDIHAIAIVGNIEYGARFSMEELP